MDCWHMYCIDEWNGGRPAGTEKWIGEGKLEMPTSIAAEEQLVFQVESYPTGMQIQNIRSLHSAARLRTYAKKTFCISKPP